TPGTATPSCWRSAAAPGTSSCTTPTAARPTSVSRRSSDHGPRGPGSAPGSRGRLPCGGSGGAGCAPEPPAPPGPPSLARGRCGSRALDGAQCRMGLARCGGRPNLLSYLSSISRKQPRCPEYATFRELPPGLAVKEADC